MAKLDGLVISAVFAVGDTVSEVVVLDLAIGKVNVKPELLVVETGVIVNPVD